MNTGKEKCERLRAIRKEVARQYGLDYAPVECTHRVIAAGLVPNVTRNSGIFKASSTRRVSRMWICMWKSVV